MPNPLSRYEFRAFIFSRFPRCSVYVSESKRSKIRNWSTRPSYKVLAALPEGGKMSHRECGRGAARAWPLRRRTDEETKAVESGYVLTISLRTLLFSAFFALLFSCFGAFKQIHVVCVHRFLGRLEFAYDFWADDPPSKENPRTSRFSSFSWKRDSSSAEPNSAVGDSHILMA